MRALGRRVWACRVVPFLIGVVLQLVHFPAVAWEHTISWNEVVRIHGPPIADCEGMVFEGSVGQSSPDTCVEG
jgi:hypothetical protein